MAGTAAAAAAEFTVTRTSSDPASASARTWATVAATSAVSVFVIDWTTRRAGTDPDAGDGLPCRPAFGRATIGRHGCRRNALTAA
jgi:hypothetical protein